MTTGAWCYYNSDPANGRIYGKLYNWYAVTDPRGIAPTGWHVPTDAEWSSIINYLDSDAQGGNIVNVAGGKMKTTGTSLWLSPNTAATNVSGFTSLPGGCRYDGGSFNLVGRSGIWWSSSENNTSSAWYRCLGYTSGNAGRGNFSKRSGFSVRCLRD